MAGKILEPVPTEPVEESKADAFKRLATKRVTKLIDQVRLLGNLSARGNYDYSDEQIEKIFSTLETELAFCRNKFAAKAVEKKTFEL